MLLWLVCALRHPEMASAVVIVFAGAGKGGVEELVVKEGERVSCCMLDLKKKPPHRLYTWYGKPMRGKT